MYGITIIPSTSRAAQSTVRPKPLLECSPAEIVEIVQSGKAGEWWKPGDYFLTKVSDETIAGESFAGVYREVLLGLDHNMDAESEGRHNAHFGHMWQDENGRDIALTTSDYQGTYMQYGFSPSSRGFPYAARMTNVKWSASMLRMDYAPMFLNCMDPELREVITPCTKTTQTASGAETTLDTLFALSSLEIEEHNDLNVSLCPDEAEQVMRYAIFEGGSLPFVMKSNAISSSANYWSRSVYSGSSDPALVEYDYRTITGRYNTMWGLRMAYMIS